MSTIKIYLLIISVAITLAATTTAAIIFRDALPGVALAVVSVPVLIGLYMLYRGYRSHRHTDQIREEEHRQIYLQNAQIEAQTEQIAAQTGQIQAETARIQALTATGMLEIQAKVAAMTSFVYPTSSGHYPAIMGQGGQYMLPPTAQPLQIAPPAEQREISQQVTLPRAPHFNEMKHQIGGTQLILCYDQDGPVYGEILDLLSTAITGKPGRGKTTALMYYVAILLQAGAEIVVFDPHGAMSLLSEFNGQALKNMPETAKIIYLSEPEDMYDQLDGLTRELAKRNERYKRTHGKPQFLKHPLLLLADELPALASYDLERKCKDTGLMKMIRRFVLEARKWNCYFIGSSQTFDAQTMPTQIRDSLSSRMVFYSSDMRAKMAGLEKSAIETLLPLLKGKGKAGMMIFDCQRLDDPIIAAIPMLTQQDLADFVGATVEGTIEYYDDDLDADDDDGASIPPLTEARNQNDQKRSAGTNLDTKTIVESNDRDAFKNVSNALIERLDVASGERPEDKQYRFTQDEIKEFKIRYQMLRNIDETLRAMNKGTRYRAHARELIQALNLRQA